MAEEHSGMLATFIPAQGPPAGTVVVEMTSADAFALATMFYLDTTIPKVVEEKLGIPVHDTESLMARLTDALGDIQNESWRAALLARERRFEGWEPQYPEVPFDQEPRPGAQPKGD